MWEKVHPEVAMNVGSKTWPPFDLQPSTFDPQRGRRPSTGAKLRQRSTHRQFDNSPADGKNAGISSTCSTLVGQTERQFLRLFMTPVPLGVWLNRAANWHQPKPVDCRVRQNLKIQRDARMFATGTWQLLLLAGIVLLLFGNRLPSTMRSLGLGIRSFQDGLRETGHVEDGRDVE